MGVGLEAETSDMEAALCSLVLVLLLPLSFFLEGMEAGRLILRLGAGGLDDFSSR